MRLMRHGSLPLNLRLRTPRRLTRRGEAPHDIRRTRQKRVWKRREGSTAGYKKCPTPCGGRGAERGGCLGAEDRAPALGAIPDSQLDLSNGSNSTLPSTAFVLQSLQKADHRRSINFLVRSSGRWPLRAPSSPFSRWSPHYLGFPARLDAVVHFRPEVGLSDSRLFLMPIKISAKTAPLLLLLSAHPVQSRQKSSENAHLLRSVLMQPADAFVRDKRGHLLGRNLWWRRIQFSKPKT
jgi:hypothetical protein